MHSWSRDNCTILMQYTIYVQSYLLQAASTHISPSPDSPPAWQYSFINNSASLRATSTSTLHFGGCNISCRCIYFPISQIYALHVFICACPPYAWQPPLPCEGQKPGCKSWVEQSFWLALSAQPMHFSTHNPHLIFKGGSVIVSELQECQHI